MAKAYWINFYRSVSDFPAFAEYGKLAKPAIEGGGGRFLVRGNPAKIYEKGENLRVIVIEFDSLEKAIATHDGAAYQAAMQHIRGKVDRDLRIVEGIA